MNAIYINLFLLLCFLSGGTLFGQKQYKTRSIKPESYTEKVVLDVSGKKRSYYLFDKKQSVDVNITGPGILRILMRGQFAPTDKDQIKYIVVYTVNGGQQERIIKTKIKKSKTATFINNTKGFPGQLQDFEITLGRGDHNLRFLIDDNSNPVIAKFKFTPVKKKKQDWIRFSPNFPLTPVDLISRETTVKYYRFTADNPLRVDVNGPTELRVLTRVENEFHMKGIIQYRIQVKENGVVKNTYHLSSKRSEVAEYKSNRTLVPGKACEFVIDVPTGRHRYEISLLDNDCKTILGRVLIPKKDVKL